MKKPTKDFTISLTFEEGIDLVRFYMDKACSIRTAIRSSTSLDKSYDLYEYLHSTITTGKYIEKTLNEWIEADRPKRIKFDTTKLSDTTEYEKLPLILRQL